MEPPKMPAVPNPMSSINTITTLGAPAGASTANGGGATALRASSSVIAGYSGSTIGRTVRSSAPVADGRFSLVQAPAISGTSVRTILPKICFTITPSVSLSIGPLPYPGRSCSGVAANGRNANLLFRLGGLFHRFPLGGLLGGQNLVG